MSKKRKILQRLLAGFARPKEYKKEYEQIRRLRKKSMLYRGNPVGRDMLIKAKNKQHAKELREAEEDLGITVLA